MAKKVDPLEQWKLANQPGPAALAGFEKLKVILQQYAGKTLLGQSQKFPPKYTLDVAPAVRLHHGKRFASVACVAKSIYFELCQWDEAIQKELSKLLKGIAKSGYEGYEFTSISDELATRLALQVKKAGEKLLGQSKKEDKRQLYQPKSSAKVPDVGLWTSPLSWASPKATASDNYSRYIPQEALFTRGELICTLYENRGPGIQEHSERSLPGLLQLEKIAGQMRVIAAHTVGFDGQLWSFRLLMQGKQTFMPLYVGKAFDKQQAAPAELLERYRFSRITIQSILCTESGKAYCINLRENFEVDAEDEYEEE
ncbi:MAG: hypothetical protein QM703_24035 [Gemmatales bacterium]